MTPAVAVRALAGRREAALAALPSVQRMIAVLAERCREPSWIRTSVASLDRFATIAGGGDLEALLARARLDPHVAENALLDFAYGLEGSTQSQVAALAIGPKLWFTFNEVTVPWSTLPGKAQGAPLPAQNTPPTVRLALLAMIGSGLHLAELRRARLGDVGLLDRTGELFPDLSAEPLALRYRQVRGARDYITFLTFGAREALLFDVAQRAAAGQWVGPSAPLLTSAAGQRFNRALVRAGNSANVELCRTTGDFFRAWGMPGSHFAGTDVFTSEEDYA